GSHVCFSWKSLIVETGQAIARFLFLERIGLQVLIMKANTRSRVDFPRKKLVVAILALTTLPAVTLEAQTNSEEPTIEEVVVSGRLRTAARALVEERIEQSFSAEILGIEQIGRAGDSDLAAALRRVTGLTLIDGKYIYVRGLGERYSSATLNGAEVPSPELSRNVIALDLFP